MVRRIVECVPNISEGRNGEIIEAVVKAAGSVIGAKVLDVDPGSATNRTVITIAGIPEAVLKSAFLLIEKAGELIDMRTHIGEHPRHGATDVCPFVPVSGLTMEDCAELARQLGKRVGEELGIPVYLYEKAASKPEWEKLPNIREGEYEALPDKLGKSEWKPDFGPNKWNDKVAKTGVCTIGARNFLIAYNVNLNSRDAGIAREIGLTIRDTGRNKRDSNWKFIKDKDGSKLNQPGLLQYCKATGWFIDEYNTAQVTMNLTDISITPLHIGYETTKNVAESLGVRVTGSEVVGLVPLSSMIEAGKYYLQKQNDGLRAIGRQAKTTGVPERELIEIAVRSMGLREVAPFNPDEKIIEYLVEEKDVNLSGMSCHEFVDELSIDSPAPGGGSVAALTASMGAALVSMVANLTVKSRKCREYWDRMLELAPKAQELKEMLMKAVDDDTRAFNRMMDSIRSGEEIQEAIKGAIHVPLNVLKSCSEIAEMAVVLEQEGLPASLSDSGVAALMAMAAAVSAYYNVLINLEQIEDREFIRTILEESQNALESVEKTTSEVRKNVEKKLLQELEEKPCD